MPVDPGRVAVLSALRSESRPLTVRLCEGRRGREHEAGLLVLTTGQGRENALRAVATARAAGATALVSWGLAGALVDDLRAGTILMPTRVLEPAGQRYVADPHWCDAIAAALGPDMESDRRDVIAVSQVLCSVQDKQSAAAGSGAVAADMESGAIAHAAAQAGIPFIVIRVVVDEAADALPEDVAAWVDERGRTRIGPLLSTVLRPSSWRGLKLLATRYRSARATLDWLADRLVPLGFALPAASAR